MLLGQALPIEHELKSAERQILDRMGGRIGSADFFQLCRELDVNESSALEAVRSLVGKRLVSIETSRVGSGTKSASAQ
jgi:hypothetical protein